MRRYRGLWAERCAARYLKKKGLILIEKNAYCRFGEIDLIMQEEDTWVFVEVRSRRQADFMHPFESINHRKQQALWRTAQWYMQGNGLHDAEARFDAVSVVAGQCEWIKNAFNF